MYFFRLLSPILTWVIISTKLCIGDKKTKNKVVVNNFELSIMTPSFVLVFQVGYPKFMMLRNGDYYAEQ